MQISAKDKFVILASDGVWEHMSNQEVRCTPKPKPCHARISFGHRQRLHKPILNLTLGVQAVDVASKYKDPKVASEAIVQAARKRWQQRGNGYMDDVTAVVVRL